MHTNYMCFFRIGVLLGLGIITNLFSISIYDYKPEHGFHDVHEIEIPFEVRDSAGKKILEESIRVHLSDSPATITKKIQHHMMLTFQAMSAEERLSLGGFADYGLDPQRWMTYQGTKMFKMFSKEQALIDNYDRFDRRYHVIPFTVTYIG